MPPPARSENPAPPKAAGIVPGHWLDERDKRLIGYGLGGSIIFGLGLMMLELQRYDVSTQDPDAQTPVIAPDYPRHLVDFSLTDESGRPVTRVDLQNQIVVVDFIFTSCTVTCPYVNAQMKKIQDATAGQPVRLLSLTLDPVDDTVPVLARYSSAFGADPTRWSFLTGDETTIHNFVETSFLPPDTTGQFSYMPGNFAHVQRIVLVDKAGRIVSYFDGLNQEAANTVIEQIKKLESSP
jgi:cytochrome oxidase Cu insertion factor (SCO1/SenC/PrrC family)